MTRILFLRVTAKVHVSMFILSVYKPGYKLKSEDRRTDWFQSILFQNCNASSAKKTCLTKSKWVIRKIHLSAFSGLLLHSLFLKGSMRTVIAKFLQ